MPVLTLLPVFPPTRHKDNTYDLNTHHFEGKTVLNEEIPAIKWLKKVKYVEAGRNDFCSDY